MNDKQDLMRRRQKPLCKLYLQEPSAAWVTDVARTEWRSDNPLRTDLHVGPEDKAQVPVAVHTAVGGDSDAAVPGDVLCAALASCVDSTMRVIANRMRIGLEFLEVNVSAGVDVRGTLCLNTEVPVGFQGMDVSIALRCAPGVSEAQRELLVNATEHCCVVLQTLKNGVTIRKQVHALETRHAVA